MQEERDTTKEEWTKKKGIYSSQTSKETMSGSRNYFGLLEREKGREQAQDPHQA